MTAYEVVVSTRGREIYLVDADSQDEAFENWDTGTLVSSEVVDAQAFDVVAVED